MKNTNRIFHFSGKTAFAAILTILCLFISVQAGIGVPVTVKEVKTAHIPQSEQLGYSSLDYVTRKRVDGSHAETVILAVDGSCWAPDRSIVNQECLADREMLFVRSDCGNSAEIWRNRRYAACVVKLFSCEFPAARNVVLYAYSKGGWYIDSIYEVLREQGYSVLFYWCNDACPSQRILSPDGSASLRKNGKIVYSSCALIPNGIGYAHLEADKVPIYVATSKRDENGKGGGSGLISEVTEEYAFEYCQAFGGVLQGYYTYPGVTHGHLGSASAADFANALSVFDPVVSGNITIHFISSTFAEMSKNATDAFSKSVTDDTVFVKTTLKRCVIAQPETNDLTDGDPVYVFFPGTGEMDDINHVNSFVRKYRLYDNMVGNLITVSTKNHASIGNPKDWKEIASDVADYLEDYYNKSKFLIRIDTISFGGRGGVYLAEILMERGIPVDSLNLGDSCGDMGAYTIKPGDLKSIAKSGTIVNIAASDRTSKWSLGTRNMITELANVENVNGYIKNGSHTEALGLAIHEDGIHAP